MLPDFSRPNVYVNSALRSGRLWVYDIIVDPQSRSNGLGQATLDAIKAYADKQGLTIMLAVGADEDGFDFFRLKKWYTANDFVPVIPQPVWEYQMTRSPRNV